MAIISKWGYLIEVGIKRSWDDFKADFKKGHTHDDPRVYYFYYCVPESIADKVTAFCRGKYGPRCPAILCYTEDGQIKCAGGGTPHRGGRKLFLEEQLTASRLGCMRLWNLKEKLIIHLNDAENHV